MPVQPQYLTFLERVSQVYLNKYTIVALLISVKLFLFKRTLLSSLDSVSAQATCGEATAEYPEKVSKLINNYIQNNLGQIKYSYLVLLQMIISIIKNLILFYVEIFLGTYTCLLNAALEGSANFAFDTSETVIVKVNDTIVGITEDIQDGLDGLSLVINTLVTTFSKIKDAFTGTVTTNNGTDDKNKISLSINALKRISIPASVLTDIESFRNQTLPEFSGLENSTNNLISAPFDYANKQLSLSSFNSTNSSIEILNNDTMPVLTRLNSVCSSEFPGVLRALHKDINLAAKYILITLLVVSILCTLPLIYAQFRHWRRQKNLIEELTEVSINSPIFFNNVLNRYNNPFVYYSYKFNIVRSPKALWMISYVTSPYAQVVLFIGLAGFLAVLLQWILLKIVSNASKSFLHNKGTGLLNVNTNSTDVYIQETNVYLADQESFLNEELFGHIRNVSQSLNTTLVSFMSGLTSSVNNVFGGTPFQGPISTVVYCTIGRKVQRLETGLTWINANLKISIPSVSDQLKSDIQDVVNNSNKDITSLAASGLEQVTKLYSSSLWYEFLVSLVIFGLWVLQLLAGLIILLIKGYTSRDDTSTYGDKFFLDPNTISEPMPLTQEERQAYSYPYSIPYQASYPPSKISEKNEEKTPEKDIRAPSSSYYDSSYTEFPTRTASTIRNYSAH